MEDSAFPFRQLTHKKYLTLEVMMHIKYEKACKYLHNVNKVTRAFLENNASTIRNAFINDGLIEYKVNSHFKNV